LAYVGRLDEPRKGFPLMLRAFPHILRACPGARLLVVGGGDIDKAAESMPPDQRDHVTFLGRASDEEKAAALKTADLYVAPNTGGESFGIVLVEAMASGATVLASDLPAFRRVLGGGRFGALFAVGDAEALAAEAVSLLSDPSRRHDLDARATTEVRRYDWSTIAEQIVAVYETVAGEVVRR
jgi:phosphatidylinositol alpha-mannosyltransferase